MVQKLHILYIEDNPADVTLTKRALSRARILFDMHVVSSEKGFLAALDQFTPDIILSDHSLPGFNSLEAYEIVRHKKPGTPFILLTGSVSEQFAVDCLVGGIDDYILKSNLIRLPSSIERILSKKRISNEKDVIEHLHMELKEAYTQIEEKNKEITDSINYAKRIQDAVLPHHDEFGKEFNAGFVIYEPRNIVSGDLYWLAKTTTTDGQNLSLKVIAAVDCTGHGVPGAFMSLLVSELLNQTLKNKNINSPADVLSYLNYKLPFSLNKHNKERITDGLDMAICAIDPIKRIVYFAGANRPMWVVRKNNTSYDLFDYKGSKASIGAHTPANQVFENNTISLQAGDRLFLFTDGITDQFGGISGKKMGRRKLKEILLGTAQLKMQQQKEQLVKFLKDWRGSLEQVDDMLLIGIEIE